MTDDDTLERARTHIGAGQIQQALDLCLPLANTGNAEAIYLLAIVSHHGAMHEEALNLYREAAKQLPDRADVFYNFGVFLREQGQVDGAIEAWMQAAKLNSNHWQASFNLGVALSETQRDEEAVAAYEHTLRAAPGNVDASFNMGNVRYRLGQWADARTAFEQVLKIQPKHTGAQTNLGLTLVRSGDDVSGVKLCRDAVSGSPDHIAAHVNLGHALLAAGDWHAGFRELEWRWKVQIAPAHLINTPHWDGGKLNGSHLVLYGEQGHGDVLQFVRFVSLAREMACAERLSIVCHPALKGVVARVLGVDDVFALDEDPGQADATAALMSLPTILWRQDSRPLPPPPYIQAPPPRFFDVVSQRDLRVGLVWRGNRDHANDVNRSCALSPLLALCDVPGVHLFSLQWQSMTVEEQAIAAGHDNFVDLGHDFDGFDQAAEILAGLDVLVTVDTAMAHLAGAMGLETWLILPKVSDWRWRTADGYPQWYPQVRLFQKTDQENDWSGVVTRLSKALSEKT
ncbi:MAG: glycosyltransferase family protein [Magnetovibrio sp.]|nr:glycosyltransferase family protein [Magnetovibrio sp.]